MTFIYWHVNYEEDKYKITRIENRKLKNLAFAKKDQTLFWTKQLFRLYHYTGNELSSD